MRLSCIVSLAAGVLSAIASEGTAQGPNVEILAEYPPGNFLENLDVLSDGRVVFTSYFAKTIEILDNRGTASTLAHVSAHPVSILAIEDGFLVAAHGQAFTSGPAFVETQQFLLLDTGGREVAMFKAPEARFLNGMVSHSGGTILVADSVAGKIWQVDPKAHSVIPWLADGALAQDPSVKEFRPGANGLKRQGDHVLVSNSSRGTLATIAVDSRGLPLAHSRNWQRLARSTTSSLGQPAKLFSRHTARPSDGVPWMGRSQPFCRLVGMAVRPLP